MSQPMVFTAWVQQPAEEGEKLPFPAQVQVQLLGREAIWTMRGPQRELGGKVFAGHTVEVRQPLRSFAEMVLALAEGLERAIEVIESLGDE